MQRTPRFADRVFTSKERDYCQSKGAACFQSYAARFAAKEAFLKAIHTGLKVSWKDIEVQNDESGTPYLRVKGKAAEILQELGATKLHLSISHTSMHAIAIVVIEKI